MAIFLQDFEIVPNSMCFSEFLQDGRKNTGTLSEFSANYAHFTIAGAEFSANYADFAGASTEFSVNVEMFDLDLQIQINMGRYKLGCFLSK